MTSDTCGRALMFVDGEEIHGKYKFSFNNVSIINHLKPEAAIEKYGEKGKYGAMEITTNKEHNHKFLMQENGETTSLATVLDTIPSKVPTNSPQMFVMGGIDADASINMEEWRKFLSKNLQSIIEESANKGLSPGAYTIQLRILIDVDGTVTEVKALNDPGYGFAEKTEKMALNSPKWNPAMKKGKPVKAYHVQPITFVISDGSEKPKMDKNAPKTDITTFRSTDLHNLLDLSRNDEILSFVMAIDDATSGVRHVSHLGNEYTPVDRDFFNNYIVPGKTLTMEDILVKRNGKMIHIPSRIFSFEYL